MVGEQLCGVLILTAFSQRDLIEQARDAGALAYLVKPFQKSDLVPALEVAHRPRPASCRRWAARSRSLEEQFETRKLIDRAKGQLMDNTASARREAFAFIQKRGHERARPHARRGRARPRRRARSPERTVAWPRLLLLDGNSLTYRAFFALPTDMATAGGPGHQRGVRVHVDAHQPAEGPPARRRSRWPSTGPSRPSGTSASPPTRRNRDEAPDILRQQMGLVRQVVDALGIPSLELAGFEADDIIATLADAGQRRRATTSSSSPATATRYQLVEDPHVKVLYNRRGVSRLRALRRGRHLRAHRRHAGALPAVRRATGRPVRQPSGRARGRREDGGQAHHQLRRDRRHLRAPRRADAEAAGDRWPSTRTRVRENARGDGAAARRADRGRPRRLRCSLRR